MRRSVEPEPVRAVKAPASLSATTVVTAVDVSAWSQLIEEVPGYARPAS